MSRFCIAILVVGLGLGCSRLYGYGKMCYENAPFNRFEPHEMLFKREKKGNKKWNTRYVLYSDHNGERWCYVWLNPFDKRKIEKSLGAYGIDTVVTTDMIQLFLKKRRNHDQMVGWVLQDFLIRFPDSLLTVGQVLKTLGLDKK